VKKLTSSRPYLLRAVYDWLIANEEIPQIMCDASLPGCEIPREHVKNDKIVFNIGPLAVRDLKIGDDFVFFNASFSQVVQDIVVPVAAVMAIFARDTNEGMFFSEEDPGGAPEVPTEPMARKKMPHLRIVKSDRAETDNDASESGDNQ